MCKSHSAGFSCLYATTLLERTVQQMQKATFSVAWVYCNKCYKHLGHQFANITLTACGHFLCDKCFQYVPGVRFFCPICNTFSSGIFINSERDIPDEVRHYFESPEQMLQKINKLQQQFVDTVNWQCNHLATVCTHLTQMTERTNENFGYILKGVCPPPFSTMAFVAGIMNRYWPRTSN